MSNELQSLLARVDGLDATTGHDLRRAVEALAGRREYGLNFERHLPEQVTLFDRPISVGDKVRCLPPRGAAGVGSKEHSKATWVVTEISGPTSRPVAVLLDPATKATAKRTIEDVVYAADFRDAIYPGLKSTGTVERGGDKPFHAVINSENYHALEAMLFMYERKVDCIYIDPPYNTGDPDWKYNNDYVDKNDLYRHSKWLSFMERRLKVAQRLLNPRDSVLIVTIDEKEYLRLGLLLEQTFSGARIQMISTLINPAVVPRAGAFGRSDEYIYFVMIGDASPQRTVLSREWVSSKGRTHKGVPRWDLLRRSGESAARDDSPGCFYPIYVDPDGPKVGAVGDALAKGVSEPDAIEGLVAVLPIRKNGTEGRWQWQPRVFRSRLKQGRVRVTGSPTKGFTVSILKDGEYRKVVDGEFDLTGYGPDGAIQTATGDVKTVIAVPGTQWRISSHDSTQYGSRLLAESLLPNRKFPYPKSLYAVEDTLRFFIGHKLDALVVDFFSGSGTTAHAVMRLNRQDDGRRRSICVTNNEVSVTEQSDLRNRGLRAGDPEWEALGICDYITKPRIRAAVTGEDPDGQPVKGNYKFGEEFPMADGFDENIEFFTLTYQNPALVELNLAFEAVAPLLWMRAGSTGRRINAVTGTFDIADTYGVLFKVDATRAFLGAIQRVEGLRLAFIVTDDETQYQAVASQLPEGVESVRLYESYLRSFQINTGRT